MSVAERYAVSHGGPPVSNRMSVRQAILECLRRRGVDCGEDAMIVSGEYGYWVGLEYVAKSDVSKILSEPVVITQ